MNWIQFHVILLGKFNQEDIDKIRKAFVTSQKKHAGQFRDDGTPYFSHVIRCACMAIECGIRDVEYIILLLLHDSVEETKKHRKPYSRNQ
jgi:(p)ppGpp synthase/HD superfamily hydrolase